MVVTAGMGMQTVHDPDDKEITVARKKGLLAAAAAFAASPQGKRMIRQAREYVRSPQGKAKIAELKSQVTARKSRSVRPR